MLIIAGLFAIQDTIVVMQTLSFLEKVILSTANS